MKYEYISEEPYCPNISFDGYVLELEGESYMENPYEFYLPILDMIDVCVNKYSKLVLNNKLHYMNTTSSRCIYEILSNLKTYQESGTTIEVNWYYDQEDQEMLYEIEDTSDMVGIEINKIEV
jgi:hypothetical protein